MAVIRRLARAISAVLPWPQLRAVLVGLHVLTVVALSTPSPGVGLKRSAWADPTVQGEFKAWNRRLAALGIVMDDKTMQDRAWAFASRFEKVRRVLVAPMVPYGRYLGVAQAWRMFVAPHRYPTRLEIDLRETDDWRPIYIERSPEHTWQGRILDGDRTRSSIFRFGWSQYRKSYENFCVWVARQAARDFPTARAVRVRMYKYRTPSPEEVRTHTEPEGTYQQEIVLDLQEYRAPLERSP